MEPMTYSAASAIRSMYNAVSALCGALSGKKEIFAIGAVLFFLAGCGKRAPLDTPPEMGLRPFHTTGQ